MTSGKRFWQDGTPVAGQQYEYAFDDIGNRKSTGMGGDADWGPLRRAVYTPNRLNQYSERDVPSAVDILGIANPTAPVRVNANVASRKGEYFHYALSTPNSGGPWFNSVTVQSDYQAGQAESGTLFVPKTREQFDHDEDGNLVLDGRWIYTWDAENRLVRMESLGTAPAGSRRRLEFAYDHQGRRIWERITNLDTSAVSERKFLYDDWNLVAVLNADSTLRTSFVWGLDLSGSLQGAGGIGGLLALNDTANGCHFAAYDGNGNVTALVSASTGDISGRYEYGPFGEVIRATGPMAKANPFRWSTQYTDDETDLVCYLHRYYNPSTGRWLSRDPIGEVGGENLYGFVENDPIDFVDFNGLTTVKKHAWSITQQQAMSGIWGWTDLESQEEKPAKLKMKKKLCLCVVTKKPEMVFTISVQTARSGKQSWKESAVFDGVTYPDTSVYVGSGLASLSKQHEEKRFQAWKTAVTGFWPGHYEDPAAKLTAPTCDELKAKIDALRQQAATEWETSAEGRELIRRLIEIGQEGASVSRWVRKSGFGSVRVVYDTN